MSFPNIPNITPTINLSREEVINLLLASIALEELSLAHIVNAEAEKIQAALGTLSPGISVPPTTFQDLINLDQSVSRVLRDVISKEMLLLFKLEDIIDIITASTTTASTTTASTTTASTTTASTTTASTTTASTTTASTTTASTTTASTTTASTTTASTTTASTTTASTTTASTTTTTTTTTSTTSTTTTATTAPLCAPALTNAIFVNGDFTGSSQSIVNANVQINGNLTLTHNGNTWMGTTKVHGTASVDGNAIVPIVGAPVVPQVLYDETCLFSLATITVPQGLNITVSNEAAFAGQIVLVNGDVNIGTAVTLPNTTIIATGNIDVSGADVTISNHAGTCFALYSSAGNIDLSNGNYNVTGLVYTRVGDITISASHGGNICGSIQSGGNVIFSGGSGSQNVTNTGTCSPCGSAMSCNTICPASS